MALRLPANLRPVRDVGWHQALWPLFGFDLGIELAQLGLMLAFMPWPALLTATRAYHPVRVVSASLGTALAAGWLLERTAAVECPLTPSDCRLDHRLGSGTTASACAPASGKLAGREAPAQS